MNDLAIDIAEVVQLSVAPVFLLAGIGAFLNVLANRLARVIDRARAVKHPLDDASVDKEEFSLLKKRARLINVSLSLCTLAAILVCTLIIVLFVFHFLLWDKPSIIASLFVAAMASLLLGLLLFQTEVYLAIKWLRVSDFKRIK